MEKTEKQPLSWEECLNEIAKKYDYKDWNDIFNQGNTPFEIWWKEASTLFAQQSKDRLEVSPEKLKEIEQSEVVIINGLRFIKDDKVEKMIAKFHESRMNEAIF